MKIKKIGIIFFILQNILSAGMPPAQIGMSPGHFEITYDGKSKTHSLKLMNYSNRTIHARISLGNWTLNNTELVEISPTPQSLDQWILITPVNFKVAPKKTQTIRFAIRPRTKPLSGEHRAMIWINEVPSSDNQKGMNTKFRLGVGVYLNVPPIHPKGKLNTMATKVEKNSIKVSLNYTNKGNVHDRLHGHLSLWKANTKLSKKDRNEIVSKKKVHKDLISQIPLPAKPILAKLKKRVDMFLAKPTKKGKYLIYLNGKFKNNVEFSKEKVITIKSTK